MRLLRILTTLWVFIVLSTAASASSVRVEVNGSLWDVGLVLTTYSNDTVLIESQPWWGNSALAKTFSETVGSAFGPVGCSGASNAAGCFAYMLNFDQTRTTSWGFFQSTGSSIPTNIALQEAAFYATAARIPLPGAIWFVLAGVGALAAVREGASHQRKARAE